MRSRQLILALALVAGACSSGAGTATNVPVDGTSNDSGAGTATNVPVDGTTESTGALETTTSATTPPAPPCGGLDEQAWVPLGEPGTGGWGTALTVSPHDPSVVLGAGDVFGIARSEDGGATWTPTPGRLSEEIGQITWHPTDPDVVWAATLSGPHVSRDAGQTWEPARDGFPEISPDSFSAPVEVIVFDPADNARLLAFGGSTRLSEQTGPPALTGTPALGVVWESLDGGASWSSLSTIIPGVAINDAVFVPGSELVAAVDEVGLFSSPDGGRSWTQNGSGLPHGNIRDLEAHPQRPRQVLAALGSLDTPAGVAPGGIYRSVDGGLSFGPSQDGVAIQQSSTRRVATNVWSVRVAPSDASIVYAGDTAWGSEAMYRSDDGGLSWRQVLGNQAGALDLFYSSPPTAHAIGIDPARPDHVIALSNEHVLASDDGGASWTDLAAPLVTADSAAGTGFSGLVTTDIIVDPDDPSRLLTTSFDGGNLIVSSDAGATWLRPISSQRPYGGGQKIEFSADPVSSTVLVLLGQQSMFSGIARSVDGGTTWTVVAGAGAGLPELDTEEVADALVATADGYLASIGGLLYRSTDDGLTWAALGVPAAFDDLATTGEPGATIWAASGSGSFASDDGGLTWRPLEGGPADTREVVVAPDDPDTVYWTSWRTEDAGLWRLDDSGWVRLSDDFYAYSVAVDPFAPDRLMLATNDDPFHDRVESTGVSCSTDGGVTWTVVSDGLPSPRATALAFHPTQPGIVFAGSNGLGFYRADLGAMPTP